MGAVQIHGIHAIIFQAEIQIGGHPMNRKKAKYTLGPVGGLVLLIVLFLLSSRINLGGAPEGVDSIPLPEGGTAEPLQVYFLDVGQGDSELIRLPGETGYFNRCV